jgi:hypothetical protein
VHTSLDIHIQIPMSTKNIKFHSMGKLLVGLNGDCLFVTKMIMNLLLYRIYLNNIMSFKRKYFIRIKKLLKKYF